MYRGLLDHGITRNVYVGYFSRLFREKRSTFAVISAGMIEKSAYFQFAWPPSLYTTIYGADIIFAKLKPETSIVCIHSLRLLQVAINPNLWRDNGLGRTIYISTSPWFHRKLVPSIPINKIFRDVVDA
jgi:hypothetical protein